MSLSKAFLAAGAFLISASCTQEKEVSSNTITGSSTAGAEQEHSKISAANLAIGKTLYEQCAACHLENGAGVPGAFPSLNANVTSMAADPEGRAYLVLLVKYGLQGRIETADGTYNGVMTAIGNSWQDDEIAAVLNHTLVSFGGIGKERFSADEVSKILQSADKVAPHEISALRPVQD